MNDNEGKRLKPSSASKSKGKMTPIKIVLDKDETGTNALENLKIKENESEMANIFEEVPVVKNESEIEIQEKEQEKEEEAQSVKVTQDNILIPISEESQSDPIKKDIKAPEISEDAIEISPDSSCHEGGNSNINSNIYTNNINLTSDAQIYYQELIYRNKIDLKMEKHSFAFGFSDPSKKNRFVPSDKFSIISEEKEEEKKSAKNKSAKSKTSKSKGNTKNAHRFPEHDEIKTSESVETESEAETKTRKRENKTANNIKNRKKFQSDDKYGGTDSDKEEKTRRKGTSMIDNKRQTRKSVSISAKESEEEEVVSRGRNRGKKVKSVGRGKTVNDGKKKKKGKK
jgi:hypothetical protein